MEGFDLYSLPEIIEMRRECYSIIPKLDRAGLEEAVTSLRDIHEFYQGEEVQTLGATVVREHKTSTEKAKSRPWSFVED